MPLFYIILSYFILSYLEDHIINVFVGMDMNSNGLDCVSFQGSSIQEMWFTECWQPHNISLHLWQTLTPASPETQLSSILTMVRDRGTGLCVCLCVCEIMRDRECPIQQKYIVEICNVTEISNINLSPSKTLYLDLP